VKYWPYFAIVLVIMTLLLCTDNSSQAVDRAELGDMIKTIPPNGPFWKYGNVVMRQKSKKAGMAPVVFSHWSHRSRYTCRVCHLDLGFSMRAGDTGITRAQYLTGKFCGACHDGIIAFSVQDGDATRCAKCHMKDTQDLEKQFDEFAAKLPLASFGNGIDWAAALNKGMVNPKNSFFSRDVPMQFPDKLQKPMKLGTSVARSAVSFSHKEHFTELDCSSCHPDIFSIKKKGTENFSMDKNIYGNYCGACHMLVAFPMTDCKRCHPQMSNYSGY
jgi:c(7)-type cytochrome triheme protein